MFGLFFVTGEPIRIVVFVKNIKSDAALEVFRVFYKGTA